MEWNDITRESLKANRPDLFQSVEDGGKTSRDDEVKELKQSRDTAVAKVDEFEVKEVVAEKRTTAVKLVKASKMADSVATDVFMSQLTAVEEVKDGSNTTTIEQGMQALIDDRLTAINPKGVKNNGPKNLSQSRTKVGSTDDFVNALS